MALGPYSSSAGSNFSGRPLRSCIPVPRPWFPTPHPFSSWDEHKPLESSKALQVHTTMKSLKFDSQPLRLLQKARFRQDGRHKRAAVLVAFHTSPQKGNSRLQPTLALEPQLELCAANTDSSPIADLVLRGNLWCEYIY
jgi:hypothetical protein